MCHYFFHNHLVITTKQPTHIGLFFLIIFLESWNQGGSIGNRVFGLRSNPNLDEVHPISFGGTTTFLMFVLIIITSWEMRLWRINPFYSKNLNQEKKSEKWENDRPPHSSNQTHRKLMHGDVMQTTQTANNIVARSFKGVLITMAAYDFNSMCPFCSLRFSWASLYLSEWSSSVSNFISKCSFYTSALHSEKLLLLSLFAWTKFSFFPKKRKKKIAHNNFQIKDLMHKTRFIV